MIKKLSTIILSAAIATTALSAQEFKLNDGGYFNHAGVDVMAFNDFYPEGHQGGISILMNGHRVASNGDIRFEATPGQWQPVPKQLSREIVGEKIVTSLCFPDSSRHLTGFNPMIYPDIQLKYTVSLEPSGKGFIVTVDLDEPLPEEYAGAAGFNLELFPGYLFGKPWIMDNERGIFPQQPNSPVITQKSYLELGVGDFKPEKAPLADYKRIMGKGYNPYSADEIIAEPYAVGKVFTSCPDDPYSKFTIKTLTEDLKLYDGRMNHNNGWFVLRSEIPAGASKGAVKWYIEPEIVENWIYKPIVQTSQVGYHPAQKKVAVIELDRRDTPLATATLVRYDADGEKKVKDIKVENWDGNFLRYQYAKVDFSDVTEAGLYCLKYGESASPVFNIDEKVYDRGVWQPVIEYFLPVQMCHMRVSDKYRVWHDACHMDDAQMAVAGNHLDGYDQPEDNMTSHEAHEIIEGLNFGGWHDAGDFDIRVESQAGECYILTLARDYFDAQLDATTIDQNNHNVEIHQPDGKNDIVQQIEHGALTIVNGYLGLGRLYRGIICNSLRQYVLLGDAAAMTDGIPGNEDDRWVFTEKNPSREMSTAASLAAAARSLRGYNDTLAMHCQNIAKEIFEANPDVVIDPNAQPFMRRFANNLGKVQIATELYITTGETKYFDYITAHWDECVKNIGNCAWYLGRIEKQMEGQKKYKKQCAAFREALVRYKDVIAAQSAETPYGVPYRPSIWGAGWDIQTFGYKQYFLAKEFPDIIAPDEVFNALNFVLGCHPGINQQSFASGVGAASATVGYGLNRADWSYIPGGVVSGTALIRPDFPELLVFPYLWQQVEYCLGGASTHYMFLVMAAKDLLGQK